jgi:sugar O-acyltransferase (sialic acid O-acetyltransferase NeuD family)
MPDRLIIFPFGGNARESLLTILDINKKNKKWDVLGFIDDDSSSWGKECCGVKVLGGQEVIKEFPDVKILVVPGNPKDYLKRQEIINRLETVNTHFATIIHPSVTVSQDSILGYNTIIMSNVVVSCGANIGNHCVILPNSVIAHDCIVGDYCCIGSNVTISGNVALGSNCYVGSGASMRDNIKIGENTLIGLGSNVISNFASGVVVAGNPAKRLRERL